MSSDEMQVAALGRPFALGMLYDARRDQLMTDFSLWDKKEIKTNHDKQHQPFTDYIISSSDNFESNFSMLDMEVSLQASFLADLFDSRVYFHFLNDKKKSENHSKVSGWYKARTFYDHLDLSNLPPVTLQIQDLEATHVVTGILYGANAKFAFDSERLESSRVVTIEAKMMEAVEEIPKLANEDEKEKFKFIEENKAVINKFTCKFYGDFILKENPTTFEDAVTTFSKLPELLGEKGENSVPVKVWLTPLKDLDVIGAELKNSLSPDLVKNLVNCFENIREMEMRCRGAQEEKVVERFPQMDKKLKIFLDNCDKYTTQLKKPLNNKIPLIRGGKEDETWVKKLLDQQEESPFSNTTLDAWLDNAEREINIIMSCLDIMEGIQTVPDEKSLDRQVLAAGVADLFCFVFSSVETDDPFLDQMTSYVSNDQTKPPPRVTPPSKDQWFFSDEVVANMRKKAREFTSAAKQLKGSRRFRFLAAALPNKRFTGGTVYQFRDGSLKTEDFSQPNVPDVTAPLDRRDLAWYHCSLTLDPNTCNGWLNLSDGNRKATCGPWQEYPDNPQRFDTFTQALCSKALTEKHYFEVEWSTADPNKVGVALAYNSIERKGRKYGCCFGENPASWYFGVNNTELSAWHNGEIWSTSVPAGGCSRVGVYLDWPGGSLSFYQVSSDALTHMYTFRATFTEPLYPGLYAYNESNFASFSPM